MGAYLSSPITEKESEEGSNDTFGFGVSAMQGWRTDMEDAHAIVLDVDEDGSSGNPTGLFAIFDGHGGKEVAKFAANHLRNELVKSEAYKEGQLDQALVQTFLRMDEILVMEEHKDELKALKGEEEEDPRESKGGIVVDSSQLPESLLEVLGVPNTNGFQIRLIRSGPTGRMQIDDIMDNEEAAAPGADEDAVVDAVQQKPAGETKEKVGPGNDPRESKRQRQEMEVDEAVPAEEAAAAEPTGPFDVTVASEALDAAEVAGEDKIIEVEELSTPRSEEEWGGPNAGCTAVCALVRGNNLVVANAGDSRCILSRKGNAVALTQDHKPMDPEEYSRIIKAGGFVAEGRVNGSLNLSRALGDLEYKMSKELPPAEQMVTAVPEIRTETLQPGDEFLLLACDGIWDVMTNQEAITFVRERLLQGKTPKEICEDICDACLAPDTGGCGKGCDNMSVAVVVLKPFAELPASNVTSAEGGAAAGAP